MPEFFKPACEKGSYQAMGIMFEGRQHVVVTMEVFRGAVVAPRKPLGLHTVLDFLFPYPIQSHHPPPNLPIPSNLIFQSHLIQVHLPIFSNPIQSHQIPSHSNICWFDPSPPALPNPFIIPNMGDTSRRTATHTTPATSTGTRNARTTKPVAFPLKCSNTAQLKLTKLVPGTGEEENVWTTSCSHPSFRLDPSRWGSQEATVVLCQFRIREIVQEYPILKIRLSRNVDHIMKRLEAFTILYLRLFIRLHASNSSYASHAIFDFGTCLSSSPFFAILF
jgi:hypothetical protein